MAQLYFIVPTPEGAFGGLDLLARAAFGAIFDRWKLSEMNNKTDPGQWIDERGVYCVYDQRDMARLLGVTLPTLRGALTRLESRRLIATHKPAIGSPVRYYIDDQALQWMTDPLAWSLGV